MTSSLQLVRAEFVNAQSVPAWKPIVQEVKEEHDLDNATNPGLNVRVARHVDLPGHFADAKQTTQIISMPRPSCRSN